MTVLVVPFEPLESGVLGGVVRDAPITPEEGTELYRAMVTDAIRSVANSGGDLLVNYPSPDRAATDDPEQTARDLVGDAGVEADPENDDGPDIGVAAAGTVRFEVQVGSTPSARAGNALTHLLEEEGVDTAAVLSPRAPLVGRTEIDGAAMRLRNADAVLGPTNAGGLYYAGFTEPVDFTDAWAAPALPTMVERARAADAPVDFLPQFTRVTDAGDLAALLATIRARETADRAVPEHTTAALDALGLDVTPAAGETSGETDALELVRPGDGPGAE